MPAKVGAPKAKVATPQKVVAAETRAASAAERAHIHKEHAIAHRVEHVDRKEAVGTGKAARRAVPRSSHSAWEPPADRTGPVAILAEQATSREPDLIPIRHGRMLVSPFTFYRGAAAVMAADLAHTPASGFRVQLCGDAHLLNFGGYASPERDLVFDVNDFDETLPGPWEWDVKRLAASLVVAGRGAGLSSRERRSVAETAASQYREAMLNFAARGELDVWYAKLDEGQVLERIRVEGGRKVAPNLQRTLAKARSKDHLKAFAKLTTIVDGEPRFVADPPLLVPVRDLVDPGELPTFEDEMTELFRQYRQTLQPDRRHLLEQYRLVDLARKVVGVGSVGTRCWVALLIGRDDADPLFLQIKEAQESVLAPFAGKSTVANQGERVVEGQRLMQASSDIFLGWIRATGMDGRQRDFYARQLWDWKISADPTNLTATNLGAYGRMCSWTLARAHARSGDRIAIAAYLGNGPAFDVAIAQFAEAYADQNERDYEAFTQAVQRGELPAVEGV
jgi:uncharacterized protein (DUF2252 family)